MPLDAICLQGVVKELSPQITGSRIEKIQQPAREQGVLLLRGLAEVLDMLEELAAAGGLPEGLFTPLVKTLGIALVSRLGGEICRDAGQGAMVAGLDTAGAFGAVLVSLPLVRAAWELLRTLV